MKLQLPVYHNNFLRPSMYFVEMRDDEYILRRLKLHQPVERAVVHPEQYRAIS
jgi:hypothetical protein